jgi:L,D-transpeptidase YcbB
MNKLSRMPTFLLLIILLSGCFNKTNNLKIVEKDTSITESTAVTNLILDSVFIENFIMLHKLEEYPAQLLRNFYVGRNYQYAWFNEDGLSEHATTFWNLKNLYIHFYKDSSLYDNKLNEQMEDLQEKDSTYFSILDEKNSIELKLTQSFFKYAQYAYAGKIDPQELQWYIPRKKIDAVALLDSLSTSTGETREKWESFNPQYMLMKQHLTALSEIEKNGGWPVIDEKKSFKKGNKDSSILDLKKRLFISGFLPVFDSSIVFDESISNAVKLSQNSFGFNETGIPNKTLLKALNIPVKERIEQLLINMERMRWLPDFNSNIILVANIPEFKLHIFEDKKEISNMNIVVGKAGTKSAIFTDILEFVVFSPYWNVPRSITVNELLPAMRRNRNYLNAKNMEITGYSNGVPIIRQRPGGANALGKVKFIFPNNFNIYFHDTPSKSLFKREKRAFSHGCIRLEKPFELAEYLLKNDTAWTKNKIEDAMNNRKEKWVRLKKSVPVVIAYFTSWVDDKGTINYREDIYGHDAKMKKRLFQHAE